MKNIIIVGAGGFAKELFGYLVSEIDERQLQNYQIKGFLDISEDSFKEMKINSHYLGTEDTYVIDDNDEFLIAIGDIKLKEKIITKLLDKQAKIMTYIHSTAFVDSLSIIGEGSIICPYCMVNSNAVIGDYSMLNIYSSVAHDSILGRYSILSPYATLNGNVKTDEKLFVATRGTILPGVQIGKNCVVAAGTVLSKNIEDNSMAYPKSRTSIIKRRG